VTFPIAPSSTMNFETGENGGSEYAIVAAITQSLGLQLVVNVPSDGKLFWGWNDFGGQHWGELIVFIKWFQ